MRAKIVIGLGWGDEGKGITTDFLCSNNPTSIVVRFSGGHQAGHTVIVDGKRHIFASFGSGTLRGCPTYISSYCVFYPPNIYREKLALNKIGVVPSLYIHPLAKLTSPQDIAWGRTMEMINKHGSCGKGIGATMARQEGTPYKLFAVDLLNKKTLLEKLRAIEEYYRDKLKELDIDVKYFHDTVKVEMENFFDLSTYAIVAKLCKCMVDNSFLGNYENLIFEGSQGIMLDMEHGLFPNVTYAHTTSKNAMLILKELHDDYVENVDVYYVTRCYQTRHGNGWMPSSDKISLVNNENETNVYNEWQGQFRVAELDYSTLNYALKVDSCYHSVDWVDKHLVVTCLDQRPGFTFDVDAINTQLSSIHHSYSPESKDFRYMGSPVRL